ncbi:hypothetical protein KAW65_01870 [candidate division WOR-3 bacterium]|nr:hypothetical protein [candidate division WOR-3 bacterium]
MSTNIWVWIAALLTLSVYSFLYKDNPIYRFAEYLFIGTSVGYSIGFLYWNAFIPRIVRPVQAGDYIVLIPTFIGLLFFARFTRKWTWLVRYPIAISLGIGAGISIPLTIQAGIFRQLQATMVGDFTISNIIMVVGVICTLFYFFFSLEQKGVVGGVAKTGIWYIMIAFGAIFGYTVMARIALFVSRVQFLLHDWLGIIK